MEIFCPPQGSTECPCCQYPAGALVCFVLIRYTDDCWDYAAILWNGAQAAAVQAAFEKLTYREQRLWEERNAICMTCGRVSPLSERKTFAELAAMFEGSIASGAETLFCQPHFWYMPITPSSAPPAPSRPPLCRKTDRTASRLL